MARVNQPLLAFNRGVISPLGLARIDLDRLQLSAEIQTNWMPRVLGSMMLRPGFEYIYGIKSNNKPHHIPFIAAVDDTAIIELTDSVMRISIDEVIITRPAVTAAITNGLFTTDLTGWTDADEAGAAGSWATGGYLNLLGTGTNEASQTQSVTVNETGIVHAVRVIVNRGPVKIRIGSTATDGSYHTATLGTGTHSLAFTPTGNFYINLSSVLSYSVRVDSVAIESSGALELPSPYIEADLASIRHTQSADVVYLAGAYQQRKVERRNNDSWSIVLYETLGGPFGAINVGPTTITPSALSGDITLTASKDLFVGSATEHSGLLYRLVSSGQVVQASVIAEDNFTGSVLITGVGTSRNFSVSIAGTWAATCTLQRSIDDATWEDVQTYTANTTTTFNDGLDNVEYYYRIGVKTGGFTSGTIELGLSFSGGSLTGVAKIRSVTSATVANATVTVALGGTAATDDWYASQWSDTLGWPTANTLYEGRLWHAGKGKMWGSVSDGFEDLDDAVEGDSGPINRFIGEGPVDDVNWLIPLQRLILGTAGAEISARSTSFDEPLTPSNFNFKDAGTEGSANVDIVKDGIRGLFIQRAGSRLYQLQFNLEANDYIPVDLSELAPEITEPSIVKLGIQRQPDTRIHCIRSDGKVAVLVKDAAENTLAWVLVETDGVVEDVIVLPGTIEDKVYYSIKRTINGATVRYLEKWALESEGRGGVTNKLADSFVYYSGVAITTITSLGHLEGETVVVWGNGKNLGTFTVLAGGLTLPEAVTSYCIGLGYTADFLSTKLAYAASMGTALGQVKKVNQIGIIARDIHASGLQIGPSFTELYDLPTQKDFQAVDADTVHLDFDTPTFPFGGHWNSDSRVAMRAVAPKPVTVLAAVIGIQTNDKA
jgi:hypothetical protein